MSHRVTAHLGLYNNPNHCSVSWVIILRSDQLALLRFKCFSWTKSQFLIV